LAGELEVGQARLAIGRLEVPDLRWFGDRRLQLSGSAEASLNLERDRQRTAGSLTLRARGVDFTRGELNARTDAASEIAFVRLRDGPLRIHPLKLTLDDFSLRKRDARSEPVRVVVESNRAELEPSTAAFESLLDVSVSSSRALLPLLVDAPLRQLTGAAFDLRALQGRVALELGTSGTFLQVLDAKSGRLQLRGYLKQRKSATRGAFLVSSGPFRVGVTVRDGSTEVSPLVGADWLVTTWPRVASGEPPG
jgi:hypothetical protein